MEITIRTVVVVIVIIVVALVVLALLGIFGERSNFLVEGIFTFFKDLFSGGVPSPSP